MASCLVIHIFLSFTVKQKIEEVETTAKELMEYYFNHPYLELDQEIVRQIFGKRDLEKMEQYISLLRRKARREFHLLKEEEQEELDRLTQRFKNGLNDIPYIKYGFIPAKKSFISLLTYMFIHAGWLHLLGNLIFLYLTGPFIEDVWGRPTYAAFYMIMGILSALMFSQHYPHLKVPLIGASGAIAGVMGAFLIRYWRTKIEFFYMFFIFIRGTFRAPAWFMLPLWFLLEFFNAKVVDSINPEGGGGVAHWAHVWGFIFGVVVAFLIRTFRIEERHVHPKIEAKTHYENRGLKAEVEAIRLQRLGRFEEAYTILLEAARSNPMHLEVVESLWKLGVEMGRESEVSRFFVKLIEREIRHNQMDNALNHFRKLKEIFPQAPISQSYKIMLIRHLTEKREFKEAKNIAENLFEEIDLNSSPGLLMNFAQVTSEFDDSTAERVIELCLQHPEIPIDQKEKFKMKLDELKKKSQISSTANNAEQIKTRDESLVAIKAEKS